MQYEFKLKEKILNTWDEKYLCICDEKMFDFVYKKYSEFIESRKGSNEYILLINLLDDNGDFVRVIQ